MDTLKHRYLMLKNVLYKNKENRNRIICSASHNWHNKPRYVIIWTTRGIESSLRKKFCVRKASVVKTYKFVAARPPPSNFSVPSKAKRRKTTPRNDFTIKQSFVNRATQQKLALAVCRAKSSYSREKLKATSFAHGNFRLDAPQQCGSNKSNTLRAKDMRFGKVSLAFNDMRFN